jgi:hypothetical protein
MQIYFFPGGGAGVPWFITPNHPTPAKTPTPNPAATFFFCAGERFLTRSKADLVLSRTRFLTSKIFAFKFAIALSVSFLAASAAAAAASAAAFASAYSCSNMLVDGMVAETGIQGERSVVSYLGDGGSFLSNSFSLCDGTRGFFLCLRIMTGISS